MRRSLLKDAFALGLLTLSAPFLAFTACGGEKGSNVTTAPTTTTTAVPPTSSASALSSSDCPDAGEDQVIDFAAAAAPSATVTGKKPSLPPVPDVPVRAERVGDAYTVHGAVHALRSRWESAEVTQRDVTIVGYIIDTNMLRAPRCAIHRTGIADPPKCVTEIPAFTIADSKTLPTTTTARMEKDAGANASAPAAPAIRVLGWARNFPTVYEAQLAYQTSPLSGPAPKQLFADEVWSVSVPWPLPGIGAKVKVTGRYGFSFTKSSTGIVSDPKNGVLTYTKLEYLEPAAPVVLRP